ncbi:MAG TPA: response regulator [Candidatus Udaeobacter sp.]|jgi:DNA-binding NtrC family response regulator|nr:response regulator [Candidatus Udaeobacter sp.]
MGWHVLVVEDDAISRRNLAAFLGEEGYSVETANSGPAALRLIGDCTFDAVVSDFQLGGRIDGVDVLSHFERSRPGKGKVLISGRSGLEAHCATLGAVFIAKPLNLTDLLLKLQSVLPKQPQRHQTDQARQAKIIRRCRQHALALRQRSRKLRMAFEKTMGQKLRIAKAK